MSQSHIDRIIADWSVGLPAPCTLSDIPGASFHQLINLSDEWVFAHPHTYCPWSDIPHFVTGVGLHLQGSVGCIAVDNGMALVVWLLFR